VSGSSRIQRSISETPSDSSYETPRRARRWSRAVGCIFAIPPIASFYFALPCYDYGFTIRHLDRGRLFVYGGHAIFMAVALLLAVVLTYSFPTNSKSFARGVTLSIAVIYVLTTALCWLIVALGVVSWP
jgi:hypothetical protein